MRQYPRYLINERLRRPFWFLITPYTIDNTIWLNDKYNVAKRKLLVYNNVSFRFPSRPSRCTLFFLKQKHVSNLFDIVIAYLENDESRVEYKKMKWRSVTSE